MGKLGARLRSFLGNQTSPPNQEQTGSLNKVLQQRIRRVSESFLDNERLTADLDDSTANELLDWGLNLGRLIVQGTADVEDDEQADEAMYPRLRAARRLMRGVNRWVASQQEKDQEGSSEALNQIIEQAQVIYGKVFTPPSEQQKKKFLQVQANFSDSPPRLIANLRQLFTDHNEDA